MVAMRSCLGNAGKPRASHGVPAMLCGLLLTALAACGQPEPVGTPGQVEGERAMTSLPRPRTHGGMSIEEAIAARRSIRSFSDRALSAAEISQLLWAAQGITDTRQSLRAAPSAGATYPLEVYAVTAERVARYIPREHALETVVSGDRRAPLAGAALGQACVRHAPLVLVFSAVNERTTRRYGDRGIMYVHMEAGHAAQNVHLQAVALGLGSVPVGAFDPKAVAQILGIPQAETVLYLIPVGAPDR